MLARNSLPSPYAGLLQLRPSHCAVFMAMRLSAGPYQSFLWNVALTGANEFPRFRRMCQVPIPLGCARGGFILGFSSVFPVSVFFVLRPWRAVGVCFGHQNNQQPGMI